MQTPSAMSKLNEERYRKLQAANSKAAQSTMTGLPKYIEIFLFGLSFIVLCLTVSNSLTVEDISQQVETNTFNNDVGNTGLSSSFYDKERSQRVKERLEFIANKKKSGKSLLPPEEFDVRFLEFTKTKSRVSGLLGSDHCTYSGPKHPAGWSKTSEEDLLSSLSMPSFQKVILKEHLEASNAQLLSPEHKMCTTKHAIEVPESITQGLPSAYQFEDVCVVFNLDSLKMSQRGLIIFDNTNNNPERCVACPNPQMSKHWGSTECGIMWLHQINIHEEIGDFQKCYDQNRNKIQAHGQRQRPGEANPVEASIYYRGTTLLLQFVQMNPGHQLWDFFSSVLPILYTEQVTGKRIFDYTVAHQIPKCDDSIWICAILRKMNVFKTTRNLGAQLTNPENLIPTFDGVLTCFEKLITPIPGWNHDNSKLSKEMLQWMKNSVTEAFGLRKQLPDVEPGGVVYPSHFGGYGSNKMKVLMYPHNTPGEAGKRRAWLDVDKTFGQLKGKPENLIIPTMIEDMAKVSVENQAKLFYENDVLIMSHGGQMGNAIFCRRGTLILEVTCGSYSQMQVNNGAFTQGLELIHVVYRPCNCADGKQDSSNYLLPEREVLQVIDSVLKNERFGHLRRRFGSTFLSGASQADLHICGEE